MSNPNATVNQFNKAMQKIAGKWCNACRRNKPMTEFDIVPKKSTLKCRACALKYVKPRSVS